MPKKKFILPIMMLALSVAPASAQWYLFPGGQNTGDRKDTVVNKPTVKDTLIANDGFVLDIPKTINVALMLPFNASDKPSSNFLDFYCGALMAVQSEGEKGRSINLNVFDTESRNLSMQTAAMELNDVIIGPVRFKKVQELLPSLPEGKYIVSPLDKKTEELVALNRVIQAPCSWKTQSEELVKWLAADITTSDAVILVREEGSDILGEQESYIVQLLESSGIQYSTVHTGDVSRINCSGTIRTIIVSDNDIFASSAINNISKLAYDDKYVLYTTSKTKSLDGLNIESLYKLNTHLTTGYYIDYSAADVQDFVLKYRGLYKSEPSSFAFQGYDMLNYYIEMCATYGRQWAKRLYAMAWKGLQSDFLFNKVETAGNENKGVLRIVYSPDLSISPKQ